MPSLPETMRAAQAVDYDDVRIIEMAVPRPGPGEALVKVKVCGICAGDVTPWYIRKKCPIVVGHEPAGQIVALGTGTENFAVGDRVFVHHHAPCNACRHCEREAYSMCTTWRTTNLDPGGIAEYLVVPATNLQQDTLKLPEGMSYEEGALIEPVACVVKAFHRARIQPGDRVAVVGLGFIGQVMVKLARHYGASVVMASDLVPWRLEQGRKAGADLVVDASTQNFAEEVRRFTGGAGADLVMVGPSKPAVMQQALACAGQASTVLLFMAPEPGVCWDLDVNYLFFNEISLVSSYSCGPPDTRETLELIRNGIVKAEDLITHRFPMEQTLEACRLTARAQDSLKVVVHL
jgi:L-iditol 2-dehydrogenase